MLVLMVQVREMGVAVAQPSVLMPMAVGLASEIVRTVFMLVMLVVNMCVVVFQWLMDVVMLMSLGKMQVDADRHESGGDKQLC